MRKRTLLGTTALAVGAMVAPGIAAAEEPVKIGVGGYMNEFFGIGSVDGGPGTDLGNTNLFNDGEIYFSGETKLDNGLTIGVQVELEAFQSGDQIDESYVYIQGGFGKAEIGAVNLANYKTFWDVVAPAVGVPINSGWITVFTPMPAGFGDGGFFLSPLLTTNLDVGDDPNSINYYSPRFAGFQFTAGFAPTISGGAANDQQATVADEGTQYHNAWGIGLNFNNSFNGIDIVMAAGYNQGSVPNDRSALGADDFQQAKIGAAFGVGGFSIAGSYANQLEGKVDGANTVSNEGQAYDIGAKYSTGPWAASLTYFHGEQEDTIATTGDDEADSVVGAVSYALGPGITTSLSLFYGKFEDEGGAETDATVGILGLAISF